MAKMKYYLRFRSLPMFMDRLPNLTPGGFQLCNIGGYFLLVRRSAELCDNNDWSLTLPQPFAMCYNPEAERAANSRPKCWLITEVKDEAVKVFFQYREGQFEAVLPWRHAYQADCPSQRCTGCCGSVPHCDGFASSTACERCSTL